MRGAWIQRKDNNKHNHFEQLLEIDDDAAQEINEIQDIAYHHPPFGFSSHKKTKSLKLSS